MPYGHTAHLSRSSHHSAAWIMPHLPLTSQSLSASDSFLLSPSDSSPATTSALRVRKASSGAGRKPWSSGRRGERRC